MGDLGFWWKLIFAVDTSKRCYGNPFLLLAVSSRIRIINYNYTLQFQANQDNFYYSTRFSEKSIPFN